MFQCRSERRSLSCSGKEPSKPDRIGIASHDQRSGTLFHSILPLLYPAERLNERPVRFDAY